VSDPPGSLAKELIDLPPRALRRRVKEGFPIPVAQIAEAMRGETAHYYHADAARARRIAKRVLEFAELSEDSVAVGWGNRTMAEALFLSGHLREAEPFYKAAEAVWESVGKTALVGQLLVARTHLLALLGRYGESESAAIRARRYLEEANDQAYLAKLAMNRGNVHFQRDNFDPALREYQQASESFARLGIHDQSVIGVGINQGIALSQLNREDEALALFERLETECERLGHDLLLAQVRMNTAYVHSQRADFDLSLRNLAAAADYFRETEHPAFLGACHLNRAEIYHQLNLHREALDLAEQAIPLFSKEGMVYDRALATAQAAFSQLALGSSREALSRIRHARALFEKEDNESRIALMELLWAEVLARRRDIPPEAREHADASMKTFRRLRLLRWEAAAAILVGRLEERQQPASRQIGRLRRLLQRVPSRLYPMTTYRILQALGDAQERSGNVQAATGSYRRAVDHLEDIRTRIPTEESKIAFLQDKAHLYERLLALETSRSRPSIDRIFEWMERSRAQSLWDRLRDPSRYLSLTDVGGRVGPRDRKLTALRRRLTWLHARIAHLELGSTAERTQASNLQGELEETERAWSRLLREKGEAGKRERDDRIHPAKPTSGREPGGELDPHAPHAKLPSLHQVSIALPQGWGFASFHLSPEVGLVLVASREGCAWRRLAVGSGRRLRSLADRLDFQWNAAALACVRRGRAGNSQKSALERDRVLRTTTQSILAEVYELLWKPVEELQPSQIRRWVICPHGPIHRIPIHALWDRKEYLAARYDFSTVPSARTWAQLPVRRRRRQPVAWVGGLPSPQLPKIEAEVDRVGQRLAGWRLDRDLAPTAGALRERGRDADLIHLAVHGALRTDNPAYSYLRLADGPLFVHDLSAFRLPRSTVVLSACSSGRGAALVGDEWIGLARGFVQAGASAVVASLWPIDEGSTLELLDCFYGKLAGGSSAPEAVGEAQRRVFFTDPHPWAWAAFGVLGGLHFRPKLG
jgi:tetratricopeptide (TPR) repeat protein